MMISMKTFKILVTAIGLALSLSATAFQQDLPKGKSFGPEQSQAQVTQQQALTGRIDPVGQDEQGIKQQASVLESSGAKSGGSSIATAEATKAAQAFNVANKVMVESNTGPNFLGLFIMILGALVLAAVGFKSYTDKAVPLPKSLR